MLAKFAFALPCLLLASLSFTATHAWRLTDVGHGQLSVSASDGVARTQASWDYTDCGGLSDPIELQSVAITPDPPVPGKNLTIQVKAQVLQRIEEGAYADVTVKLGLVKLLTKRFDLCEEARNAKTSVQCPVEPGQYEVTQTVALPKEIPRAKFTVAVRGYTVNEDDMLCLDIKANFMQM
ncbi:ML domain-containing protein [Mycena sanguinolenta]|nr:ML domain-containing protein [Mycena sanguinolenta]